MTDTVKNSSAPGRRRPYRTPRLERLGDLRSLTLGGSPGAGDSGMAAEQDPLVVGGGGFVPPPGRGFL